jgi:predicted DCC family thiol-disulfide oxidoreductase YuxK
MAGAQIRTGQAASVRSLKPYRNCRVYGAGSQSNRTHGLSVSEKATILFDGVCNLCNASVNFVIDRDPAGYFRFGALQSEEGRSLLASLSYPGNYLDSILLVENGEVFRDSDAAVRIAKHLAGAWSMLYHFRWIPRPVRDGVYRWVARNRYRWFGRRDVCRIPTPELKARFL